MGSSGTGFGLENQLGAIPHLPLKVLQNWRLSLFDNRRESISSTATDFFFFLFEIKYGVAWHKLTDSECFEVVLCKSVHRHKFTIRQNPTILNPQLYITFVSIMLSNLFF